MGLWTEYILVQGYISSLQSAQEHKTHKRVSSVQPGPDINRGQRWTWECHSLAGRVPAGPGVVTRKQRAQSEMGNENSSEVPCQATVTLRGGEKHYRPAGPGLQLQVLWNRNHMRGVFHSARKKQKQTHGDSSVMKRDDLCVLFGGRYRGNCRGAAPLEGRPFLQLVRGRALRARGNPRGKGVGR